MKAQRVKTLLMRQMKTRGEKKALRSLGLQ
jgi:hypothetical protein